MIYLKEVNKMPNYKKLFYASQAEIADTIEKLENIAESLKSFMCNCEDIIIESDDENENENE